MRQYRYYWSVDSMTGSLNLSTNLDHVTRRCHDYYTLKAPNIKEAWERARTERRKYYTSDGLPKEDLS